MSRPVRFANFLPRSDVQTPGVFPEIFSNRRSNPQLHISLGSNIVGNIWDNVSTQLKKISELLFEHFNMILIQEDIHTSD